MLKLKLKKSYDGNWQAGADNLINGNLNFVSEIELQSGSTMRSHKEKKNDFSPNKSTFRLRNLSIIGMFGGDAEARRTYLRARLI